MGDHPGDLYTRYGQHSYFWMPNRQDLWAHVRNITVLMLRVGEVGPCRQLAKVFKSSSHGEKRDAFFFYWI